MEFHQMMGSLMDSYSSQERCAILSILASFNTQDALNICKAFRSVEQQIGPTNEFSFVRKKLSFVLITCRYFLSLLSLDHMGDRYNRQEISLHQYCITIDGVYSRSIINEILLDLESSRFDLQQIINHAKTFDVGQLPGTCGYLTLLAACRLPLVESKSINCINEAMLSFQSCIGSEGQFRSYLPVSLVLALTVAAATMRINSAFRLYKELMLDGSTIDHNDTDMFAFLKLDSHIFSGMSNPRSLCLLEDIKNELMIAYRILQQLYLFLRSSPEAMSEILASERTFLQPFKPLSGSMTSYLPDDIGGFQLSYDSNSSIPEYYQQIVADEGHYRIITDPLLLSSDIPRSSVGILLAAISKFLSLQYGLELRANDPRTTQGTYSLSADARKEKTSQFVRSDAGEIGRDDQENDEQVEDYNRNEEVYNLVYWAYQLEIIPGPLSLWNLAYASLGVNRVQEAFGLFKQCHEQLVLRKRRLETTKPASLTIAIQQEDSGDESKDTNLYEASEDGSDASSYSKSSSDVERETKRQSESPLQIIQLTSVQHIIGNNSAFERHHQQMLQWLGMCAQPLLYPWLPAVVLAELSIRYGLMEQQIVRSMQLLFETLTDLFDGLGFNILEAILVNEELPAHSSNSKRIRLSPWDQLLSHKGLKPVVFEEGLGTMFDLDMEYFHDALSKNQLVLCVRKLLSSRDAGANSIGAGLLMTLIQYGKCHAEISRLDRLLVDLHCGSSNECATASSSSVVNTRQLCEQERFFHQSVAFRCFSFLYMVIFDSAVKLSLHVPVQIEGEILLHYLLILSECKRDDEDERREVIAFLKQLLQSPTASSSSQQDTGNYLQDKLNAIRLQHPQWYSHLHPRLVHLLALSITRESSHSPETFAVAISLLQNLIYHQYTNVKREKLSAINESHSEHFDASSSHGGACANESSNHDAQTLHDSINFLVWNIRYTIMLLLFYSGDYGQTLIFAEDLVKDIRDFMQSQRYQSSNMRQRRQTSFPFFYNSVNGCHDISITNSMACRVLLHISQICCKLHKVDIAKFACTEYFRILYSIDGDVIDRLVTLANKRENVSDHEIIDTLKDVPTVIGWKLYTGYGFSDNHDLSLEADGICQCAHIIQVECGSLEDSKRNVIDLLNLAISICPTNVRTLSALAQIFQDRFRKLSNQHTGSTQKLQHLDYDSLEVAFQYVKKALFYNSRNSDLW